MESNLPDWVNTVLGAVAGAAAAAVGLRRRFSKDSSEIAQDKAQTQLITTLMAERDVAMKHARDAWEQRLEDARAIAHFEGQRDANERETARLRDELFSLRLQVRKLTAIIARVDPQAYALLLQGSGDGVDDRTTPGDAKK